MSRMSKDKRQNNAGVSQLPAACVCRCCSCASVHLRAPLLPGYSAAQRPSRNTSPRPAAHARVLAALQRHVADQLAALALGQREQRARQDLVGCTKGGGVEQPGGGREARHPERHGDGSGGDRRRGSRGHSQALHLQIKGRARPSMLAGIAQGAARTDRRCWEAALPLRPLTLLAGEPPGLVVHGDVIHLPGLQSGGAGESGQMGRQLAQGYILAVAPRHPTTHAVADGDLRQRAAGQAAEDSQRKELAGGHFAAIALPMGSSKLLKSHARGDRAASGTLRRAACCDASASRLAPAGLPRACGMRGLAPRPSMNEQEAAARQLEKGWRCARPPAEASRYGCAQAPHLPA